MNYGSMFEGIVKALTDLARPSIILLWHLTVSYGLNPEYSYIQFIHGSSSFLKFYNYLFNSVYSDIILVVITISAILMLAYNSFLRPYPASRLIIKIFASIVLFESSYKISIFFLNVSLVFYNTIYSLRPGWYGIEFSGLSGANSFISFLFTGSFILAIAILFGILIIRQALILFFILFMPIASILLILPGSEKHVLKFYRIFFEIAFFPFFTLMILYLLSIFNNPFLEIGIIYVAATAPVFFVTEIYKYFQGSMNFLTADTLVSELSSNMNGINPASVLNGNESFGSMISGTSESSIPGIVDEKGDIH
jgi:hypothetical protein